MPPNPKCDQGLGSFTADLPHARTEPMAPTVVIRRDRKRRNKRCRQTPRIPELSAKAERALSWDLQPEQCSLTARDDKAETSQHPVQNVRMSCHPARGLCHPDTTRTGRQSEEGAEWTFWTPNRVFRSFKDAINLEGSRGPVSIPLWWSLPQAYGGGQQETLLSQKCGLVSVGRWGHCEKHWADRTILTHCPRN